jgi:general secretion pathway protein K
LRGGACRQRGIALVLALWVTTLLTVIAGSFAISMRSEALAARNAVSGAQARAQADGAIERLIYELQRPRTSPDAWVPDGRLREWRDGDTAIAAVALDESARIDLNSASQPLLTGLLTNVGGLDAEAAQAVLDAILDWRDRDDLRRPKGAEAAEYQAAQRKHRAANAPFESVNDLRLVLGVTPELYARIADSLTVFSRQGAINPGTASRDVLLALPTATPDSVDAFIAQRREALSANLPIPPFPPAQMFATAAIPVWRIHVEATQPDGVIFVRDAVVRPSVDARRAVDALLWQEGTAHLARAATAEATPEADGTRR